ncbi:hypothetical protein SGFS_004720 [Streptomyces graminofaciens]|uniref:Integrase catalytic domain-containing protein n=1 Tax=Streptomyces graminofaciens TaxID=68212 RepID=A0ABN5V852_9ACTN|nr:hypothetical protein SGFS_004720 [Streptomyces graminofaciens]
MDRAQVARDGQGLAVRREGQCGHSFVLRAEGFWAVLKEEICPRFWPDWATARTEIFDFVETLYNRRNFSSRRTALRRLNEHHYTHHHAGR